MLQPTSSPVNDATHSQGRIYNRNVGLAAVRIESVAIEDLLAFKACRFNFNRYNVIVGPDNSGKTNVRILQVLVKGGLVECELSPNIRHKDGERFQINLVGMSDYKTRMVLQTRMDRGIA